MKNVLFDIINDTEIESSKLKSKKADDKPDNSDETEEDFVLYQRTERKRWVSGTDHELIKENKKRDQIEERNGRKSENLKKIREKESKQTENYLEQPKAEVSNDEEYEDGIPEGDSGYSFYKDVSYKSR